MKDLAGKVAVITGGAGGIGRCIVAELAEAGARCVVSDMDDEWGQLVVAEIERGGGEAFYVSTDITDSCEVSSLFAETVRKFGSVDIVVNVPDIQVLGPLHELKEDHWDKKVDVALHGAFLVCTEAARIMLSQGRGGRIICISSTGGFLARPGHGPHSASKAALNAMVRAMALELGEHGITVNAVAPGGTDVVGPSRKGGFKPGQTDKILEVMPVKELVHPEAHAHAVAYLASERASFVTGQVLVVDGGFIAGKLTVGGEIEDTVPAGLDSMRGTDGGDV